uniref:Thioredoxin n=1 Tax=Candidatus Methanomethylicus mesodigestus TaxID=1867258 RepID=A0A7C3EWK1_9CREN
MINLMGIKIIEGHMLKAFLDSEKGEFIAVFSTSWCAFCRMLLKEIERAPPPFKVIDVDITDESDPTWEDYKIRIVPTVIAFRNGEEVARKEARPDGIALREVKELYEKIH